MPPTPTSSPFTIVSHSHSSLRPLPSLHQSLHQPFQAVVTFPKSRVLRLELLDILARLHQHSALPNFRRTIPSLGDASAFLVGRNGGLAQCRYTVPQLGDLRVEFLTVTVLDDVVLCALLLAGSGGCRCGRGSTVVMGRGTCG